jgi:hypothetical protein
MSPEVDAQQNRRKSCARQGAQRPVDARLERAQRGLVTAIGKRAARKRIEP